mmetsp:Transcript_38930/g.123590  ORF Transcript_38930/g.123590 Transcript_38930/m.123590 type:complete len:98 (+) Transcript_38930:920-1213(+)
MQSLRELYAGEELLIDYAAAKEGPLGMFTIYGFAPPATYYKALGLGKMNCRSLLSGMPSQIDASHRDGPLYQHFAVFAHEHCRVGAAAGTNPTSVEL